MDGFKYSVFKMSGGRPITTLFMLTSLDGKISTGCTDELDFDRDLASIDETKSGLSQYYSIEQATDDWCLCTGKTKSKVGVNKPIERPKKISASIAVIDNNHLNETGVRNLLNTYLDVVIFTTDRHHPATRLKSSHLSVHLFMELTMDRVLSTLYGEHGCTRLTIQSGAHTNSEFIRSHLIDYVDIVVAPVIVGGDKTPSLVGGESNRTVEDLSNLALLELDKCIILNNSYVRLRYKVKNNL